MTAKWRGWLLAGLQVALVTSLAMKYEVDRYRLPRLWVRTAPVDPDMPIRGRYVSLRLETAVDAVLLPDADPDKLQNHGWAMPVSPARIVIENEHLLVRRDEGGRTVLIFHAFVRSGQEESEAAKRFYLSEPVAYFIPEHVTDPSLQARGGELWVEVSVPRNGLPRPIRLGVKSDDGPIAPLDVH